VNERVTELTESSACIDYYNVITQAIIEVVADVVRDADDLGFGRRDKGGSDDVRRNRGGDRWNRGGSRCWMW